MSKKKRKIEDFDKSEWKKLDEIEHFKMDISGDWKQQGPYIINRSGKLDYAVYVGVDKHLKGTDKEGKPILEDL
jgi:hypothetical protein